MYDGFPLVLSVILGLCLVYFLYEKISSLSIEWIIGIPSTIAFLVFSAILNGWVISCLWGWFITPMGAPAMPITSALGLAMICQVIFERESNGTPENNKNYDTITQLLIGVFAQIFFSRIIVLLIGWVITFFQ